MSDSPENYSNDQNIGLVARWSRLFIKNSKITSLIVIAILLGGLFSVLTINREGFTEVNIPITIINTQIPGATSSDVEKKVTLEIEEAVSGIDKVESVESVSSNSFSSVVVEFDFNVDLDKKVQEVKSAISSAELPEQAESPKVNQIAAGSTSMLINVIGDYKPAKLKELAEETEKHVRDIDGVSEINIHGGSARDVKIIVDLDKLNKKGILFSDIKEAIAAKNISMPGGTLNSEGQELGIEVSHELNDIDEIKDIIVGQEGGQSNLQSLGGAAALAQAAKPKSVKLGDVAKVEKGQEDEELIQRSGYVQGGKSISDGSVTIEVRKKSTADTTVLSDKLRDLLVELDEKDTIADDVRFEVVFDGADMVNRELEDLGRSGWQGLLVILLTLMIFISWRASLLISFVIPLVLLSVLLVFKLIGFTLNIITVFALILTFGIVVDNAIVVVESIQHHLNLGRKRFEASITALSEVGTALFTATLTTIIVFVPMIFIGGVMGEFIKYIPYTVITAIASSFFIAVTIIPLVAGRFVRASASAKVKGDRVLKEHEIKHWKIIDIYGNFMKKALSKNSWMLVIIFVAVVLLGFSLSIPITGKIKSSTFPPQDSEYITASIDFPRGTPFAKRDKITRDVEEHIKATDGFMNYSFFNPNSLLMGGRNQTLYIGLGDPRNRTITSFDVADNLREKFKDVEGANIRIKQQSAGPPESDFPILFQVNGDNLKDLKNAAKEAGDYLKELDDVRLVNDGVEGETEPQIKVQLDKKKMKDENVVPVMAAAVVRNIFAMESVAKIRPEDTGETINLNLLTEKKFRDSNKDLEKTKVPKADGSTIELKKIAKITEVNELASINKYDGKRYIKVQAELKEGTEAASVEKKIKNFLSDDKLEDLGLEKDAVSFRGEVMANAEALDKIFIMLLLALIFVYIILVAQFNSFFQPLIIVMAVPLALIGVFPALLITGNVLSFLANVGVVALVGIVVNDAIVFIDYANQLYSRDNDFVQALITAGQVRFKPILSTSITTIGGVLPLALVSDFWGPIGMAIIGGLAFSTIGTLVVIPAAYTFLHNTFGSIAKALGR